MKVSNKAPKAVKSPVRITDTQYEMWFCKPISLGKIDKQGQYWYTSDGMRFVSSRNALDYLIKLHDLGAKAEVLTDAERKELSGPKPIRKKVAATPAPVPVEKRESYNQNHPAFQEYLDLQANPLFQDFMRFVRVKKQSRDISPPKPGASAGKSLAT